MVPASLLSCKAEPRIPETETMTDVQLEQWHIDLLAAGCDCRDKLAAIRALQAGKAPPATSCSVR